MPIHLPPISRRDFLRRSLIAGAGLALAPNLYAAPMRRTDKHSWALLADTHIAADATKINRDVNMAGHLKTVTADILSLAERPAGAFVVGDCAFNSGEKADYATFTGLLEPVRAKEVSVWLTLGNHDQRENFRAVLTPEKVSKPPVADKQVLLVRGADANWFILDSLDKTLVTPGQLGEAQLDWLAKSLDANPKTPALVLIHHNPDVERNIVGLTDTEKLFAVIRPRRQVKAYIFGHTHLWKIAADPSGIHLINLPPVAYPFRPEDPAGWVQATLRRDGMKLQLRCVDTTRKEHGTVTDLKWRES